jgi:plasmid stabilization system protein ParE
MPSAEAAYFRSLQYIAEQDEQAADLVIERVDKSLALIVAQPEIGTPTSTHGRRRFPIPKTGHVIEYRVTKKEIRITRWARHTRKS